MNQYVNDNGELNLNDCLKYIFRHWLILVFFGLALAAFLVGYKKVQTNTDRNTTVPSEDKKAETTEDKYEKALSQYNIQNQILQYSVNDTNDKLQKLNDYMSSSLLMKIDPYHTSLSDAQFLLDFKNSKGKKEFAAIIARITSELSSGSYLNNLADQLGSDTASVAELISYTISDPDTLSSGVFPDKNYTVQDSSTSRQDDSTPINIPITLDDTDPEDTAYVLNLSAKGIDAAQSETIMDAAAAEIKKLSADFSDSCDITQTGEYSQIEVSDEVASRQDEYHDRITSMTSKLESDTKKLENLDQPVKSDYTSDAASAEQAAGGMTARQIVKYGLIGFVLGVFLAFIILFLRYIFDDKLANYERFSMRFKVRLLGSFRAKALDKQIQEAGTFRMIAANIKNSLSEETPGGTILLTGLANASSFEKIASKLQEVLPEYKITAAPDIADNPDSRAKLADHQNIVLLEQRMVSRYGRIREELAAAEDFERKVVGIVIA